MTHGELTAQRWQRWLESPNGKHCADAASLEIPPRLQAYLQNRLWHAFIAGAALDDQAAEAIK